MLSQLLLLKETQCVKIYHGLDGLNFDLKNDLNFIHYDLCGLEAALDTSTV